ncbi:MAG: tRNA (adenosine(37)-N6)-threonylcarbamoyltransferase complex ATPase subunit type 1 TsaE [Candidatus Jorgensenbacteria bacterium]
MGSLSRRFHSLSPEATKKLARAFARTLAARVPQGRRATVVGLTGDLGSGKTTFTQGFARGLGIRHRITSPTFVIFRNYKLFIHMDAYRIRKISELAPLGFKKILADPKNIVLVEWAENIKKSLPRNTIYIRFGHGKKRNERKIEIRQA